MFQSGEKFRISIPKSGFVNNINGNFNIVGKVKNYPIFYGEAPSGKQDYTITFDSFGDELASGSFSASCNTGKVKVIKLDPENNEIKLSRR